MAGAAYLLGWVAFPVRIATYSSLFFHVAIYSIPAIYTQRPDGKNLYQDSCGRIILDICIKEDNFLESLGLQSQTLLSCNVTTSAPSYACLFLESRIKLRHSNSKQGIVVGSEY